MLEQGEGVCLSEANDREDHCGSTENAGEGIEVKVFLDQLSKGRGGGRGCLGLSEELKSQG